MANCSRSFLIACALVAFLSATAAAAESHDQPPVEVRVYDYASVPVDVLDRAQNEVRHLYGRIGVDTTWLQTRPQSPRPENAALEQDVRSTDVIVILLNASMTTLMAPPADVVGMAATTPTAHGHIAYVFYDRLQTDPLQSDASKVAALAFVMAHEIGHLLLPYGSHSDAGVMLDCWNRDAFSRLDVRELQFTPSQGRQIRHLLKFEW
jgi:hypothetical protein